MSQSENLLSRLRRFQLEFDPYRKQWEACALLCEDETKLVLEAYWFKGFGATPSAAIINLKRNIKSNTHLGKLLQSSMYRGKESFDLTKSKAPAVPLTEFF